MRRILWLAILAGSVVSLIAGASPPGKPSTVPATTASAERRLAYRNLGPAGQLISAIEASRQSSEVAFFGRFSPADKSRVIDDLNTWKLVLIVPVRPDGDKPGALTFDDGFKPRLVAVPAGDGPSIGRITPSVDSTFVGFNQTDPKTIFCFNRLFVRFDTDAGHEVVSIDGAKQGAFGFAFRLATKLTDLADGVEREVAATEPAAQFENWSISAMVPTAVVDSITKKERMGGDFFRESTLEAEVPVKGGPIEQLVRITGVTSASVGARRFDTDAVTMISETTGEGCRLVGYVTVALTDDGKATGERDIGFDIRMKTAKTDRGIKPVAAEIRWTWPSGPEAAAATATTRPNLHDDE